MKEVYPKNNYDWHNWLQLNHEQPDSIWLILPKKGSKKEGLDLEEAILEALCWGWIDSTPNKLNADFYKVRFSKRKEKSNWSAVNKKRIRLLESQKRIQQPGLEMIKLAKQTGTWTALDTIEKAEIPKDLETALKQYPNALNNFKAFPHSVKRGILEWIFNAKRIETRTKRIFETAQKASKNERANQFKR